MDSLRRSYSLSDLEARWDACSSEIRHWLTTGQLQTHVWLPVMSVFKKMPIVEGAKVKLCDELRHWERYAVVSKFYCHRLLRQGWLHMREFTCEQSGDYLILPETAEDIVIKLDDLIVFEQERLRFEEILIRKERLKDDDFSRWFHEEKANAPLYQTDTTFKLFRLNDEEFRFGDMQAQILRLLYEHSNSCNPWQSGKVLLQQVGSQSFTLSNLFKRNPIWRDLVLSDGRGVYRLDTKRILIMDE